jgi:hypothetical protein
MVVIYAGSSDMRLRSEVACRLRLHEMTVDHLADVLGNVSRHALQPKMIDDAHQRAGKLSERGDVDRLAVDDLGFDLLGENGGGGEAPDQVLARFGALIDATLVREDGVGDVPVATIQRAPAVDLARVEQQLSGVGQSAPAVLLLIEVGRLLQNYLSALPSTFFDLESEPGPMAGKTARALVPS